MDEILPIRSEEVDLEREDDKLTTSACCSDREDSKTRRLDVAVARRLDVGVQIDDVGCRRRWLDIIYDVDVDIAKKKLRMGRNGRQRRWLASVTEDGFRSGWVPDKIGI